MGDTTIMRDETGTLGAAATEAEADTIRLPVAALRPAPVIDFAPSGGGSRGLKLRTVLGVAATLVWCGLCATYVQTSIGWGNLLFLQPQEIGGMAGAAFVPLGFVWLLVAYFDRGRQLQRIADDLKSQLERLTYPAEGAEARVKAVADSLRAQARNFKTI